MSESESVVRIYLAVHRQQQPVEDLQPARTAPGSLDASARLSPDGSSALCGTAAAHREAVSQTVNEGGSEGDSQ